MNHTPGPWRIKQGTDVVEDKDEDPCTVAKCWSSSFAPPREEASANARLIAAAPELLAACKAVAAAAKMDSTRVPGRPKSRETYLAEFAAYEQIIAAIAKAEGRS